MISVRTTALCSRKKRLFYNKRAKCRIVSLPEPAAGTTEKCRSGTEPELQKERTRSNTQDQGGEAAADTEGTYN